MKDDKAFKKNINKQNKKKATKVITLDDFRKKMTDYRIEKDSLGEVKVPKKSIGEHKLSEVLKILKLVQTKSL